VVPYDFVVRACRRARSRGTSNTIAFVLKVDDAGRFHFRDQHPNLFARDVRRVVQYVEQRLARERQRQMRAADRSAYRYGRSAAFDALDGSVDCPVVDDGAPSAARG